MTMDSERIIQYLLTRQLSIEHSRCVMLRVVAASMRLVDSATTLRSAQNDNT